MRVFSKDELTSTQPVFLLTVKFAGQEFRFSSFPVDVFKVDTSTVFYPGGLDDFQFVESSNIVGIDLEANSISLQLVFPINIMEFWRRGHVLEGCEAELSFVLYKDGAVSTDYENRMIMLNGIVQQPVFGDPLEPVGAVAVSIERKPYDTTDGGLLIDPTFVIDPDSITQHATADDSAIGKNPPVVIVGDGINSQFISNTSAQRDIFITPAYCIKKRTGSDCFLIIAQHWVTAANVKVKGPWGNTITAAVINAVDSDGREYAYCNIFANPLNTNTIYQPGGAYGTAISLPSTVEFWVCWNQNNSGGIKSIVTGDKPLTGGGEICIWALTQGSIPIDLGSWSALLPVLDAYNFAGYINDPAVTAWDWVSKSIIPYLPIEIKSGDQGIRPVLAQIWALPSSVKPVSSIQSGADFYQIGAITTETQTDQIENDVILEFGFDAFVKEYRGITRFGANLIQRDIVHNSADAVISQQRYNRQSAVYETKWIINRYTANRVAADLLRSKAYPKRTIQFMADVHFGYLQVGDLISLTSSTLFLSNTISIITGKTWAEAGWQLTILIEDSTILTDRYYG
jgi:hypothetical protein